MKQVLIIGVSGLVGRNIANELAADEDIKLSGFSRSAPELGAEIQGRVETIQGDITDDNSLTKAMSGIEQVVIAVSAKAGNCDAIEHKAVARTARIAEQSGVKKIIYISGASTPYAPDWFEAGSAKKKAEEALSKLSIEVVILRPSWLMESLSRFERNGALSLIGDGLPRIHWLSASDLGKTVRYIVNSTDDLSGAYTLLGPQAISISDAAAMYSKASGLTKSVQKMPLWIGSLLAVFASELKPVVQLSKMYSRFDEQETTTIENPFPKARITLSQWLNV